MSVRTGLIIAILVIAAIALAGVVILRVQFNEDYKRASEALEERQSNVIATFKATSFPPTERPIPSVTPLAMTLDGSLILPTKVSP